MGHINVNMFDLAKETHYEDEYRQYMRIFETAAKTDPEQEVVITGAPWSWVPLLRYLRCSIDEAICVEFFEHDNMVEQACEHLDPADRTAIEVLCGFRPECTDALWKVDMQWCSKRPNPYPQNEFI